MISIATVVVTFNNQKTISRCLETLSYALKDFHSVVTVVDNNSKDNTAQNIPKVKFDQFEFIQNDKNVGFTQAVNQGLDGSEADYYLVLNPDVTMEKNTLKTLVNCLREHPHAGAVAPQLRFPNGTIQPSCRRFPRKQDVIFEIFGLSRIFKTSLTFNRWKMPKFDHAKSRIVDQPQGAFLLVKKKVIEKVGRWDERFPMFFSDVDFCRRIYEKGWNIFFCADTFATHLKGHSIYQHRRRMIKTSHASFVEYFKKYDRNFTDRIFTLLVSILLNLALGIRLLFTGKK